MGFEAVIQRPGAQEIGQLIHCAFAGVFPPELAIKTIDCFLDQNGHGAAGHRRDRRQQPGAGQLTIKGAGALTAAPDLPPRQPLRAACRPAGFITALFDIPFRASLEDTYAGAKNPRK